MKTLTIAGSGIKFLSHLTTETKSFIKNSDKVIYLINDPVMQEWVENNSKNSESLFSLYSKHEKREDNYAAIANYIIDELIQFDSVCVLIYGHPTVFVQPSIIAARLAIKKNYTVNILPGISAEDCLFADLLIDPGDCGCASFEATDLLLYQREFDTSSHLIIWQPFVIGLLGRPINHDPTRGLKILTDFLLSSYSPNHEVIIYEAAQYPLFMPAIKKVTLNELALSEVTGLSTLYIKPKYKKELCKKTQTALKKLNDKII